MAYESRKVLILATSILLLLSALGPVRGAVASNQTVFVGYGGVYSTSEVETGRFGGFRDKPLPFPFSLFYKTGKVITGRMVSELGLGPQWIDLEKAVEKWGYTNHYESRLAREDESWSGGEERIETLAYFDPPLAAGVSWKKALFPYSHTDVDYRGATFWVDGQEGRVTYLSFKRHLEKSVDYLNPPDVPFVFGNLKLGCSYSDLRTILGPPSLENPKRVARDGKTFTLDLPQWYFICGKSPHRTVMLVTVQRRGEAIVYLQIRLAYEVAT